MPKKIAIIQKKSDTTDTVTDTAAVMLPAGLKLAPVREIMCEPEQLHPPKLVLPSKQPFTYKPPVVEPIKLTDDDGNIIEVAPAIEHKVRSIMAGKKGDGIISRIECALGENKKELISVIKQYKCNWIKAGAVLGSSIRTLLVDLEKTEEYGQRIGKVPVPDLMELSHFDYDGHVMTRNVYRFLESDLSFIRQKFRSGKLNGYNSADIPQMITLKNPDGTKISLNETSQQLLTELKHSIMLLNEGIVRMIEHSCQNSHEQSIRSLIEYMTSTRRKFTAIMDIYLNYGTTNIDTDSDTDEEGT